MKRVVDILASFDLDEAPSATDRPQAAFQSISNVLRILASALSQAKPTLQSSIASPKPPAFSPSSSTTTAPLSTTSTSTVQDRFVDEVLRHLQQLEIRLKAVSSSWNSVLRRSPAGQEGLKELPKLQTYLVVLLRVLHVNLGLGRCGIAKVWSAKANAALDPMIQLLFRFIVVSRLPCFLASLA